MSAKMSQRKQWKHEVISALKLAVEREKILEQFQHRTNILLERSFENILSNRYKLGNDYCRGLEHGYAAAYELVAIWLQEDINELRRMN